MPVAPSKPDAVRAPNEPHLVKYGSYDEPYLPRRMAIAQDQGRPLRTFWAVKEGKLHITTAPVPNPENASGRLIGTLVWERE